MTPLRRRYGRLIVIGKPFRTITCRYKRVKCRCKCGSIHTPFVSSLKKGVTNSCGCLRRDAPGRVPTHGKSRTRLYRIWMAMRHRCMNPKHVRFKDYGSRGITICKAWRTFEGFELWALANGYSDNLSIDRKKNHLNYCPSNCRWATKVEQRRNRRDYLTKKA